MAYEIEAQEMSEQILAMAIKTFGEFSREYDTPQIARRIIRVSSEVHEYAVKLRREFYDSHQDKEFMADAIFNIDETSIIATAFLIWTEFIFVDDEPDPHSAGGQWLIGYGLAMVALNAASDITMSLLDGHLSTDSWDGLSIVSEDFKDDDNATT